MTANQDLYAAAQAAGESIARMGGWDSQEAADAALIVAAVNAFAADTEALAAVLERHEPWNSSDQDNPPLCDWCVQRQPWSCPDALDALTALGVAP